MMRRGKKSVVRVAQRVAALIPVQGLSPLFSNMYCLFDPSSTFVRFSVQNSGVRPIDHVVIMRCMVSQCRFVQLRQTWCTLVSGKRFASYGFHLCLVFLQSSTKFPPRLSYVTFLTACTWNFMCKLWENLLHRRDWLLSPLSCITLLCHLPPITPTCHIPCPTVPPVSSIHTLPTFHPLSVCCSLAHAPSALAVLFSLPFFSSLATLN